VACVASVTGRPTPFRPCWTAPCSSRRRRGDAGLDLERTEDAEDADFVLLLGSEADRIGLDTYRARVAPAARHPLPLRQPGPGDGACRRRRGAGSRPDRQTLCRDGRPVLCIGKPGAAIYEAAFAMLQPLLGGVVERARVWATASRRAICRRSRRAVARPYYLDTAWQDIDENGVLLRPVRDPRPGRVCKPVAADHVTNISDADSPMRNAAY
jgi:hypothetical protein